jgi:sulfoxide reductase heme-binding subunit YedZ
LQAETSPVLTWILGIGFVCVVTLHLVAGFHEVAGDRELPNVAAGADRYVRACAVDEIREKRARIVCLAGERVAIFRYDGNISAVSNACQHQNGPLGEGKVVDGCITCPWHGYQYAPETGASPPPFTEKVPTFNVRVIGGDIWIDPLPNPPGTRAEPAQIEGAPSNG